METREIDGSLVSATQMFVFILLENDVKKYNIFIFISGLVPA